MSKCELSDALIGCEVSFDCYGYHYDRVLVTKDHILGDIIFLLNNCHSNNNGHSDKSMYKYSLCFSTWCNANSAIRNLTLLSSVKSNCTKSEERGVTRADFEVGDIVVITKSKENWASGMDESVGKIVKIKSINGNTAITFDGKDQFSYCARDGHFRYAWVDEIPFVGKRISDIPDKPVEFHLPPPTGHQMFFDVKYEGGEKSFSNAILLEEEDDLPLSSIVTMKSVLLK